MKLSSLQRLILALAVVHGGSVTNQLVLVAHYGAGPHPNARHVAVVKAFRRLEARGLVRRILGYGAMLTVKNRG